jgi:hypothetical protein
MFQFFLHVFELQKRKKKQRLRALRCIFSCLISGKNHSCYEKQMHCENPSVTLWRRDLSFSSGLRIKNFIIPAHVIKLMTSSDENTERSKTSLPHYYFKFKFGLPTYGTLRKNPLEKSPRQNTPQNSPRNNDLSNEIPLGVETQIFSHFMCIFRGLGIIPPLCSRILSSFFSQNVISTYSLAQYAVGKLHFV